MGKVLCAFEFGTGLGHLHRLLSVASGLAATGHQLLVAVPNVDLAQAAARTFLHPPGDRVRFVQGQRWVPRVEDAHRIPTASLADVLYLFGCGDVGRLTKVVERWNQLLDDFRPDLIVADTSPGLALAVREGPPLVVLGNGYTVPPPGRPLPPIRPWHREVPALSRAREAQVLAAVNMVRHALTGPAVDHVADLFSGNHTFVCTLPEFDPYNAYRPEPPLAPFNLPAVPPGPPVGMREAKCAVYLPGRHALANRLLAALTRLGLSADVYLTPSERCVGPVPQGAGIRLHDRPLDLSSLLPQIRVLVHHGGLATGCAGLLAGVPQLVLPATLEHLITGRALERLGTSVVQVANRSVAEEELASHLDRLSSDKIIWRACEVMSKKIRHHRKENSLQIVLKACADLLLGATILGGGIVQP